MMPPITPLRRLASKARGLTSRRLPASRGLPGVAWLTGQKPASRCYRPSCSASVTLQFPLRSRIITNTHVFEIISEISPVQACSASVTVSLAKLDHHKHTHVFEIISETSPLQACSASVTLQSSLQSWIITNTLTSLKSYRHRNLTSSSYPVVCVCVCVCVLSLIHISEPTRPP